jgi:hypothetical protein
MCAGSRRHGEACWRRFRFSGQVVKLALAFCFPYCCNCNSLEEKQEKDFNGPLLLTRKDNLIRGGVPRVLRFIAFIRLLLAVWGGWLAVGRAPAPSGGEKRGDDAIPFGGVARGGVMQVTRWPDSSVGQEGRGVEESREEEGNPGNCSFV